MISYIQKINFNFFIVIALVVFTCACSTSRNKKHRCGDCPKWNKIELSCKDEKI